MRLQGPLRLLAVVAAFALLTSCTSDAGVSASPDPSSASSSSASTSAASPTPASTAAAGPSSPSDAPASSAPPSSSSPSASDPEVVTLDITVKDGRVTPNGAKVNVARGQTVVLRVLSDEDDEIHAHTADDGYELEVKAGKPATGKFVAADRGSFEVESHHLEKIIAILVVR